ncbi:MAG: RluA family pseudouridine synthase [Actinomycetota bacterium]|nr:RluA family pseudouridine synthase [Actinomycetota bacterium]
MSELLVPAEAAGTRLDRYLSEPLGSRARAQTLIDGGHVTVNGRARPKRHLIAAGELIAISEPAVEVAAADPEASAVPYGIAYEDEHLLIVDKPAGLVMHPSRGHWTGTLAQALAGRGAAGGEPWRAGIVHRLDRETSGLLVVAKDEAVHAELKALLAARRLRREYLALVEGHPQARTGTIDAPIGRDRRDRVLVSIDTDAPREARTHFVLERRLAATSLLRVTLETGRTHQIRVHLAAIGHPVCGDPQYGSAGAYGLERQFLHAARLAFAHPVTEALVDVSSPLPAELAVALQAADSA